MVVKISEQSVLYQIYRNSLFKRGQIKPKQMSYHFCASQSYYGDCYFNFKAFDIL